MTRGSNLPQGTRGIRSLLARDCFGSSPSTASPVATTGQWPTVPVRPECHKPSLLSVFLYPSFNPVIVQLGPFGIRWYALAYIAGLVLGWRLMRRLALLRPEVATPIAVDDFLSWATLGVVLGGRLGYVLFYQPALSLRPSGRDL